MVNKSDILSQTRNGLDVLRHYLGHNVAVGRKFRNPFYHDTNPSCYIYYDRRSGVYRYKDFGSEQYAGDCFDLVARIHNLSPADPHAFGEVLRIIDRDLNLGLEDRPLSLSQRTLARQRQNPPPTPIPSPEPPPYSIQRKAFSETELRFWNQCGITTGLLERYHVVSLAQYSSTSNTGRPFTLRSLPSEPMFGYLRKNGVKIYRPYSKSRFLSGGQRNDYDCFGMEQLPPMGDTLFITGGEKDVLSLAARGYAAVCFNSETSFIPAALIEHLHTRFRRIILLYDADTTGRKCSLARQKELARYGVERVVLPLAGTKQQKDITDFFLLGHSLSEFEGLYRPRPELEPRIKSNGTHKIKI